MDIARLGVALDPAPFIKGEKETRAAMDRLKQGAGDMATKMDRDGKKAAGSFNAMMSAARTAASGIRSAFDAMSSAVGVFSPKLGFALQAMRGFAGATGAMVSGLKNAANAAQGAGGGFRALAAALGSVAAIVGTVTVAIGALLAVVLPLVVAFKAVGAAFSIFSDGLRGAASFETLKIRFAGVLGSMEAAETRMKELAKLAADTPFELEGIANASLTLESLTAGAYSSTAALTAVGDAAAKSGQQIDVTAEQIGRIYAGLKTGVGFDDPLRTLTAKGVFAPEVYQQLMAMNKEGAKFADMWKIITDQLDRAGGSMQNLSVSFEGRVSTMKDSWDEFKRTLGEAILPAATDVVKLMTEQIGRLTEYAKSIQPEIQAMADQAVAFVRVLGKEGGLETAMQAAGDTLERALDEGFTATATKINAWIKEKFGIDLMGAVEQLSTAKVWDTIENDIIPRIGKAFVNAMINAILEGLNAVGEAIHGMWDKVTFGIGGAYRRGAESLGTAAVGAVQQFNTPALPANVVGDSASAAAFMADLPFTADDTVPADGASGAELLAPFEQRTSENTKALNNLNSTLDSMLGKAPKDSSPVMLRNLDKGMEGPSAALFGDQPTANQSALGAMMDAELDTMAQDRAKDKGSMSFKTPGGGAASTFMPTKRAGRVGGGGKSESEKMMDEGAKITEDLRSPTEEMEATIKNLEKLRDAGAISAETFARGVEKAKEDYNSAVESMSEKGKKAAEDQGTALQKLAAQWTDVAKRVDEMTVGIANSIASNMTSAITGMIDGTMTAKEAFSKMAASIVNDILKMTTQMLVQYMLGQAMGWFTGGIGGGAGGAVAAVAHDGGVAGYSTGESRTVSPSVFTGAQRYHSGGMVGLAPGEVPIIAEKGETITTEDQEKMKARLRGEKTSKQQQVAVTNVNVVDASMIDEHINKNPDAMLNVISRNKTRVKQILGVAS